MDRQRRRRSYGRELSEFTGGWHSLDASGVAFPCGFVFDKGGHSYSCFRRWRGRDPSGGWFGFFFPLANYWPKLMRCGMEEAASFPRNTGVLANRPDWQLSRNSLNPRDFLSPSVDSSGKNRFSPQGKPIFLCADRCFCRSGALRIVCHSPRRGDETHCHAALRIEEE